MYKEIPMYTVICDRCGADASEESDYSGWNDKEYALDCATEGDWVEDGDNHYCPDCYSYDDDNLVIKRKVENGNTN